MQKTRRFWHPGAALCAVGTGIVVCTYWSMMQRNPGIVDVLQLLFLISGPLICIGGCLALRSPRPYMLGVFLGVLLEGALILPLIWLAFRNSGG